MRTVISRGDVPPVMNNWHILGTLTRVQERTTRQGNPYLKLHVVEHYGDTTLQVHHWNQPGRGFLIPERGDVDVLCEMTVRLSGNYVHLANYRPWEGEWAIPPHELWS